MNSLFSYFSHLFCFLFLLPIIFCSFPIENSQICQIQSMKRVVTRLYNRYYCMCFILIVSQLFNIFKNNVPLSVAFCQQNVPNERSNTSIRKNTTEHILFIFLKTNVLSSNFLEVCSYASYLIDAWQKYVLSRSSLPG